MLDATRAAMESKIISKFREIVLEKGHGLKVGGVSIGRSFTYPDAEAPGEELEVSITVRRFDPERQMSSVDVRVESTQDREVLAFVGRDYPEPSSVVTRD